MAKTTRRIALTLAVAGAMAGLAITTPAAAATLARPASATTMVLSCEYSAYAQTWFWGDNGVGAWLYAGDRVYGQDNGGPNMHVYSYRLGRSGTVTRGDFGVVYCE